MRLVFGEVVVASQASPCRWPAAGSPDPRARSTSPRRGHVRAVARSRRSTSVAVDHACVPRRSPTTQQGAALPGRPAEGGGDRRRGALLVRNGKGGRRREVGMDAWAWEELHPWLELRAELPVGPLLCLINGPTRGRHWSSAAAPACPCRRAGPRRRATDRHPASAGPQQPRHHLDQPAGHENAEIIETVHARRMSK